MRVYELSKQLGISAKELVEVLRQSGIVIKSHMSTLDDSSIAFLQNKFGAQKQSQAKRAEQKSVEPMQTQPTQSKSSKKVLIEASSSVLPAPAPVPSHAVPPPRVQAILQPIAPEIPPVKEVVLKPMTVSEAAQQFGISVNDLILTLLGWRIIAVKNQPISEDTVTRLARHYGFELVKPREVKKEELPSLAPKTTTGPLHKRLPVIVVLGHVDHGKTTLLDFIRKTRVVAKEKGGITQHLGAYEAATSHGNLVFLDTPGHEAFPKMRQRGVRVADIGVLVIAANDGIMPQTVEAMKQLKAMHVPIIVAINKIDKVEPLRIEVVKRQLAEHDLLPEEWGGQTICIPISALYGTGVDQLLEMIALQAELLELRASLTAPAHGFVLESKLERGRGAVATVIFQQGTLHVGDYFTCGHTGGKVSSIKNSFGKALQEVGPSLPTLVAGFDALPEVGDILKVISKESFKKDRPLQQAAAAFAPHHASGVDTIPLLVKTDTNASREAVIDAIAKLNKKLVVGLDVIYSGVGDISESDIDLAYGTGAVVIGLHTKAETNASTLARQRKVDIQLYSIIYKLLESLTEQSEKAKPIETMRTKIGEAIVRRVFDIKGVGIIAGSYVQEGRFSKDGSVVVWRGRQRVGEGKITSLQRDKKSVKEVHTGYECGFVVEGMTDWQIDDRVECFIDVPK